MHEKTRLPQTANPFVSFINAKDFVRLMQYEEALQVMLEFTIEEEDVKELQSGSSIQIQLARFEEAFTTYFKQYLDIHEEVLKVTTLETFSNYDL